MPRLILVCTILALFIVIASATACGWDIVTNTQEAGASPYVVSGDSWTYQYATLQSVTFIRADGFPDCVVSSGNSPGITCNWDGWSGK